MDDTALGLSTPPFPRSSVASLRPAQSPPRAISSVSPQRETGVADASVRAGQRLSALKQPVGRPQQRRLPSRRPRKSASPALTGEYPAVDTAMLAMGDLDRRLHSHLNANLPTAPDLRDAFTPLLAAMRLLQSDGSSPTKCIVAVALMKKELVGLLAYPFFITAERSFWFLLRNRFGMPN